MNKLVANHLYLFLQDIIKGTRIKTAKNFLIQSQYFPENKLADLQLKKINKLLLYVSGNNSFYQKKYNLNNKILPLLRLEELSSFPLLTKSELRSNRIFSNNISFRKLTKGKTGGTTGPPLIYYHDKAAITYTRASFLRWLSWLEMESGDPVLLIWGSSSVLKKYSRKYFIRRIRDYFTNNKTIKSFEITKDTIDLIIREINRFKPDLIFGYLSSLLFLAREIKKENLTHKPKAIASTTETVLPPYRALLENTFRTKFFDQYGSGEVGSIGFECEQHEGLHISRTCLTGGIG